MPDVDLSAQKILLVDDVLFARATVKKILSSLGRPTVAEATNGAEALKFVKSPQPSTTLIVADFHMPIMNGLQLLKAIRTGATNVPRDFPIAMLTGYADEHLVDMALSLDVNAFLIKPVSRDTLAARLNKVIEMSGDTAWLKSADVYDSVPIEEAEDEDKPAAEQVKADKETHKSPPQINPALSNPSRLKGKFSASELTGLPSKSSQAGRFRKPDLAEAPLIASNMKKAPATAKSNNANEIAMGAQKLAEDGGTKMASRVVAVLEQLEKQNVISIDDVAQLMSPRSSGNVPASLTLPPRKKAGPVGDPSTPDIEEAFVTLNDMPDGAVLSRAVHTADGTALLTDGTPMTPQLVGILKTLDALDLLLLEALVDDPDSGRGIFVTISKQSSFADDDVSWVMPDEIPAGATLARDIHLVDGRLYMAAGATLTPRLISLLQDLVDLERLNEKISIVT